MTSLPRAIIADQLMTAVTMLEKASVDGLFEVEEVVADVLARVRSLELTETSDEQAEATVLSVQTAEPVTEWLLIPFGDVDVENPIAGQAFVFLESHANGIVEWFGNLGRKLAIDYEHQSIDELNKRSDGLKPAAGWIGGMEVRDDGLWAVDVSWTDRARELLASGEYRYFSPVIYWADATQTEVAGLGPVALTNDPAMHNVPALAASRRLRDRWGCDDGEIASAFEADTQELEDARSEIAILRKQIQRQAADAFVERGIREGKILDSTSMDWRDDYLADPERATQRLSRMPVLLPPGRVMSLDRRGEVKACDLPAVHTDAAAWGVEVEDLDAYERAVSAGRVKRSVVVR